MASPLLALSVSGGQLQWLYVESAESLSLSPIKRDLALHFDRYFAHKCSQDRSNVLGVRSVASSRNCRTRVRLLEVTMETEREAQTEEETTPEPELIPGQPLRPDPGWPETRGGTPIN